MYKGKRVSVVMPAYNEEPGVGVTVKGYLSHPYVDEVVVCDNNSIDRTAEVARQAGAVVVPEKRQGYGYACHAAMDHASGDLIVLTESDDSFYPEDIELLFPYIDHFDMVKSARSNCHLVEKGADWTFSMMFANWVEAKYLQLLFGGRRVLEETSHREVGGTLRVIRREAYKKIRPYFREVRHAFLPDMTTISIAKGFKVLELPVRYRRRLGVSKGTGNRIRAAGIAMRMIFVITRNRVLSWFGCYE
jgi:glycosyltransferase involved in cell wall biosynthesis